ncbi:MAG: hypothetical protein WCG92_21360, partial [Hyphomicrobiales bacterium]
QVWEATPQNKGNLLFFTGDAMGRPLLDALESGDYDLSSLYVLSSTAALFSPSLKERFLELLPNRVITDSIDSSEPGFGGTSIVAKGVSQAGGPRVAIDKKTVVLDVDGNEVQPGSGVRGILAKRGNIPVGYYKDEKKTAETFRTINGVRLGDLSTGDEVIESLDERIRGRAKCDEGGAGYNVDLTIRCAGDSYNFELQSNATHNNGAVSGNWSENTRRVGGNIEGTARGNAISVRVSGVMSATLGISTNENQQSISIQAPGTELQSVAISMNRGAP